MLKCLLIVDKNLNLKFTHYFKFIDVEKRTTVEAKIISKCSDEFKSQVPCHFIDDGNDTIIFRCFGSLMFIVLCDQKENELLIYEFLCLLVEVIESYLGNISLRQLIINTPKLHMILEEVIVDGNIVETSLKNALSPLLLLDRNT